MRTGVVVLGISIVLFLASSVHAQVTIDASKITCDQFVHGKVSYPRTVAVWLSGFYNGRRNNAMIDVTSFEANFKKLEGFCYKEKNFPLPVMQAIDQVLGTTK